MYIYEVLKRADALEPNQFDDGEKIAWLNELGAMLKSEYKKEYETYETRYDGEAIELPEDVTMDEVKRLYVRGILTPKLSLVCLPDRRFDRKYRRWIVDGAQFGDDITVVYQKRYEPITDPQEDKTVCDAPYDDMYISWLISKMCFYNRDGEGYNQHMSMFNQTLMSWRNSIKDGAPVDKNARIRGWW